MKVEELALREYPVVMTTLIPADDEHPLIEQDCNKFTREAYIKGYHQAEKDLELSWEDMECIIKHYQDIMAEKSRVFVRVEDYKELLKRFNEERIKK